MAGLFYIDIKFITNLKAISIVGFMIFFWPLAMSQEICDNAIDDDADSLVDLNDPDCKCESLLPSSLIPNPSFEEMTCCPIENERLDCAVG